MSGDSLKSKKSFYCHYAQFGVNFKGFLSGSFTFGTAEFIQNIKYNNHTLYLSGTGAHHQNVFPNIFIHTITHWSCAMLLHEIIICNNTAND